MNQRTEFVLRALRTENFRQLCQEYGISAKTGYKWKQRLLEYGLNGLKEESRRPKCSPSGLEELVVCEMVRLKQRHRHWGARKLQNLYQRMHGQAPSESSFKRVLARAGLVEPRPVRARQQTGRLCSARRAKNPNEVWTVDFKGWWYSQGQRCQPLTVRDEYSRYVLELCHVADAGTATVRRVFERLFEKHGLPEAIRSDNGPPFANHKAILGLTRLSAWWVAMGIDLERGRPGCPQDNGGHERFHWDIWRELEVDGLGHDPAELKAYQITFNHERPHEALQMKFPAEVYEPSRRRYEGTPLDLEYPGMQGRRVVQAGTISCHGHTIFISRALKGWSVGLEPCRQGDWNVWFGRLLLGHIESSTASFQAALSQPSAQEPKS